MAFERLRDRKVVATNLDAFISNQLFLVQQQRQQLNLEEESKFVRSVLEDNLTLDQQIDWRKEQLKKVPGSDRDERRRIRDEISSLKDQKEQKTFTDSYIQQLTDLNAGIQSVDTTISWLRTRLANTTDSNVQTKIRDEIKNLESTRFTQRQNMLTSQTNYAVDSQTESIIDTQINRVNNARVQALNAGLDDYVALLDLQLQSLNKSLGESKITSSLLNFSVSSATGQSALSLLNAFNDEVSKADPNTPVTIGGTRYESAQQYWQVERNEYLNDRSANGFFTRYQDELKEQVEYRESKKLLSNATLSDVQSWYDFVKDRPELTDYQDRIQTEAQKALQFTADKRSAQIVNQFAVNLDAQKAISELAYIQDKFGVDQTLNYQRVVTSAAQEKEAQVREILSTMRSILSENPGLSNQQALQQAIKTGAGVIFTPEQIATQKASDIINQAGDVATKQQGTEGSPVDVTEEATKPFTPLPSFREGELYKDPTKSTVFLYENGKLRPFAGNFSEEEFKQVTGKGFSAVQSVSNLSTVPLGTSIAKTDRLSSTAQPDSTAQRNEQDTNVGEYIPDPGLLQFYQPDQIITRGVQKYLKPGVDPVWSRQLSKDEQKQYQPDKLITTNNNVYLKR